MGSSRVENNDIDGGASIAVTITNGANNIITGNRIVQRSVGGTSLGLEIGGDTTGLVISGNYIQTGDATVSEGISSGFNNTSPITITGNTIRAAKVAIVSRGIAVITGNTFIRSVPWNTDYLVDLSQAGYQTFVGNLLDASESTAGATMLNIAGGEQDEHSGSRRRF